MICTRCGNTFDDDSNFCMFCGMPVSEMHLINTPDASALEAPVEAAPAVETPVAPAPVVEAYDDSEFEKTVGVNRPMPSIDNMEPAPAPVVEPAAQAPVAPAPVAVAQPEYQPSFTPSYQPSYTPAPAYQPSYQPAAPVAPAAVPVQAVPVQPIAAQPIPVQPIYQQANSAPVASQPIALNSNYRRLPLRIVAIAFMILYFVMGFIIDEWGGHEWVETTQFWIGMAPMALALLLLFRNTVTDVIASIGFLSIPVSQLTESLKHTSSEYYFDSKIYVTTQWFGFYGVYIVLFIALLIACLSKGSARRGVAIVAMCIAIVGVMPYVLSYSASTMHNYKDFFGDSDDMLNRFIFTLSYFLTAIFTSIAFMVEARKD